MSRSLLYARDCRSWEGAVCYRGSGGKIDGADTTRKDGTELRVPEGHVASIRTKSNVDSTYSELPCHIQSTVPATLWELLVTHDSKSACPLRGTDSQPLSGTFQGHTSSKMVPLQTSTGRA